MFDRVLGWFQLAPLFVALIVWGALISGIEYFAELGGHLLARAYPLGYLPWTVVGVLVASPIAGYAGWRLHTAIKNLFLSPKPEATLHPALERRAWEDRESSSDQFDKLWHAALIIALVATGAIRELKDKDRSQEVGNLSPNTELLQPQSLY